MKMYIAGEWIAADGAEALIVNPFSAEVIDTVPLASNEQVDRALEAAVEGAAQMARLTAYERANILNLAADLLEHRIDELARLLTAEEGKPITESRAELERCPSLLKLCAFEGSQLRGETLPLDAAANGAEKFGLTVRVPCGVVVAITPFNYPALLVIHKIGPALAAGNAVILKPASQTPLVALRLTELMLEAGLPTYSLQCITGRGLDVGAQLCADDRVRKISFTGSATVGREITQIAGVKRLTLELGSNCPLIVLPDADLNQVATAVAVSGYSNAGQACISTQRVLVDRRVYESFLEALQPRVAAIAIGDPLDERTRLAAMVSQDEAKRVESWVEEAIEGGARLVAGGQRDGAVYSPTIVADVSPQMRIATDELFGPGVAVTPVDGIEEALAQANDSRYGLSAGIFTNDIEVALRFARDAQAGNVHINGTPTWRADFMPYGGLKQSGFGKEGPRYAVQEMTEAKTIVFH